MPWFIEKLKLAELEAAPAETVDRWRFTLERVRGKIDCDGLERVSSQALLDLLEVPQRDRTAGTFRRLSKLMTELGWTAVRVRDLTRGGYKEQVRLLDRTLPSIRSPGFKYTFVSSSVLL